MESLWDTLPNEIASYIESFCYFNIHYYGNGPCKVWKIKDQIHRTNDLPAIITSSGGKEWYQNGRLHRKNNLPAMITSNGDKYWCIAMASQ
jgi:hypothetical protein